MAKKRLSLMPVMPATDKEWQARNDAETLARAASIKNDVKRMKAAAIQASIMADEKAAELSGLRSVARKK